MGMHIKIVLKKCVGTEPIVSNIFPLQILYLIECIYKNFKHLCHLIKTKFYNLYALGDKTSRRYKYITQICRQKICIIIIPYINMNITNISDC